MAVFNAGEEDSEITVKLSDVEAANTVCAKELWSGEHYRISDNSICVKLPKHGAKAFKLEEA